jgi:NAD(P)-dependent dehydrogenase (short-subunit alcohol dehydrogenase family)
MAEQIAKESNPDNPQTVIDGIAAAVPLKRLGTIDEIGDLVAFLASDEASYITGTQVVIDGGSTLPETFGAVGV